MGDIAPCRDSHSSIAMHSYDSPSAAATGSTNTACTSEHKRPSWVGATEHSDNHHRAERGRKQPEALLSSSLRRAWSALNELGVL